MFTGTASEERLRAGDCEEGEGEDIKFSPEHHFMCKPLKAAFFECLIDFTLHNLTTSCSLSLSLRVHSDNFRGSVARFVNFLSPEACSLGEVTVVIPHMLCCSSKDA
jgi:hypothetical protein